MQRLKSYYGYPKPDRSRLETIRRLVAGSALVRVHAWAEDRELLFQATCELEQLALQLMAMEEPQERAS